MDNIDNAKIWLQSMIDAPDIKVMYPVSELLAAGKEEGFKKRELKEARKEMGIVSVNVDGVQYWVLTNA